jgi:transposase
VACPQDGVVVEAIPWSEGKRPVTKAMMAFLARWARHLSWSQTARMFRTSWRTVYHSVEWFVEWGLAHRTLEGVQAIGVDEIHWRKGQKSENYLTVIYQIDAHCRRLLWVGSRRTEKTLRRGLAELVSADGQNQPAKVEMNRFKTSHFEWSRPEFQLRRDLPQWGHVQPTQSERTKGHHRPEKTGLFATPGGCHAGA